MQKIHHPADSRGYADRGWLQSHHTFSFANYHDPERMNFGTLRVINDDYIEAGMGFGTHPHSNMEIITVPIIGELRHKDSLGNEFIIREGEIQTMSAGYGIAHSEYSNLEIGKTNLLQIWVLPKKIDITPKYAQKKFDESQRKNKFQLIVSPDGQSGSVDINQDAYFSLVDLEKEKALAYKKYLPANGIYLFVIEGQVSVAGQVINPRDGLGLMNSSDINLLAQTDSKILLMEVPLA